jgi:hypothetical protein
MGLDMYLTVRHRFKYDEQQAVNEKFQRTWADLAKLGNLEAFEFEACYWRKANAIHNWFVQNVQNGVDDCASYEVTHPQLTVLRDICKKLLDDRSLAETLLPPVSGFFFGSTEIDEGYWEDIQHTYDKLTELLDVLPKESWQTSVTYQSSW